MQEKGFQRRYRSLQNNGFGKNFEKVISEACKYYRANGIAEITKIDEPFRVIQLYKGGKFKGQFTANANPDFEGTLKGGRSICFEAKYTTTDRLKQDVVSKKQWEVLDLKHKLGGFVGVCGGIQNKYYFIPWEVWINMKSLYGRKYVKQEDIGEYEVPYRHGIMFLDYKTNGK